MIKLVGSGEYQILNTKAKNKLIVLGHREFGWTKTDADGEKLVKIAKPKTRAKAAYRGHFRLYKVRGEPSLINEIHLELLSAKHRWQAYLLPNGLPTARSRQTPIEGTVEIISSPRG